MSRRAIGLLLLLGCGARTGLNPLDAGPPPTPCVTDAECDDGDDCTSDVCVEGEGCVATPRARQTDFPNKLVIF